jgi:hypothetical protein
MNGQTFILSIILLFRRKKGKWKVIQKTEIPVPVYLCWSGNRLRSPILDA